MLVPPPLFENRKQIFALNTEGIPADKMDWDLLASKTEGFTGADIASICQDAKMQLVRSKLKGKENKLTTNSLMEIIASRRPSITLHHLQTYIKFLEEYGERR
jgi:SpoVK/Ycf46/Vps4 family AAA+-type ATPase